MRIGISGWRYPPWRGVFYPPDLVQRRELEYASGIFSTIEINGTFYSLQRPESFPHWSGQTPDDFVFAIKGNRYITHRLRLANAEQAVANFLASGLLALGRKLGPILWQLPPSLRYDEALIGRFLAGLPNDTEHAAALARRREVSRMAGHSTWAIDEPRPLRHAMEVRHESFREPGFIAQLREHNVALVVADTAGKWPLLEDVTADFMYLRLHGDKEIYASGYDDPALDDWARRISAWARGTQPRGARRVTASAVTRRPRDVYCYFDNDIKVRAPFDAQSLEGAGQSEGVGPTAAWPAGADPRGPVWAPSAPALPAGSPPPASAAIARALSSETTPGMRLMARGTLCASASETSPESFTTPSRTSTSTAPACSTRCPRRARMRSYRRASSIGWEASRERVSATTPCRRPAAYWHLPRT